MRGKHLCLSLMYNQALEALPPSETVSHGLEQPLTSPGRRACSWSQAGKFGICKESPEQCPGRETCGTPTFSLGITPDKSPVSCVQTVPAL